MKRTIIKIDENLCNGCGNCVTGCQKYRFTKLVRFRVVQGAVKKEEWL